MALGLGFIPGLGAVYNGEYLKALIHVLIFGGLIAAQSGNVSGGAHAFLGVVLGCFYLYMPIEAYHTARSRLQAASRPVGAVGVRRIDALGDRVRRCWIYASTSPLPSRPSS